MKAFRSQPGEVASAGSGHMTVIEFSRSNHGPLCVVDTYNPRIASTIDNARDIVFSPRGYKAVRLHLTVRIFLHIPGQLIEKQDH